VRIGVLRSLANDPTADFEILALFDQAIDDLRAQGAVIVDPLEIPNLEKLTKATGFCSRFRYDINRYFQSLGDASPVEKLKDLYETERYHPSSDGAMKWAMEVEVAPQEQEIPCVDVDNDPRRKKLREAVIAAMDEHDVQALIYPTWNNPPRIVGDLESPHGNNSPVIAPHADQPAITVPMGFTSNGLPAGLQFLARPFAEGQLFQYAYAYEQATRHRRPPPMFP
jgi:Asp-tRNA(Asn)/Glu-tRNA(Gln) amidotransferase A subunit family amidase